MCPLLSRAHLCIEEESTQTRSWRGKYLIIKYQGFCIGLGFGATVLEGGAGNTPKGEGTELPLRPEESGLEEQQPSLLVPLLGLEGILRLEILTA